MDYYINDSFSQKYDYNDLIGNTRDHNVINAFNKRCRQLRLIRGFHKNVD